MSAARRAGRGPAGLDADGSGAERRTLDRFLSRAGVCSRAQARELVAAGRVSVDGRVARSAGAWLDPARQRVAVDGRAVAEPAAAGAAGRRAAHRYLMLHKPADCVTTRSDERGRRTVYGLLERGAWTSDAVAAAAGGLAAGASGWIAPVGRLDRDTTGLLLLTSDHDLAEALTNPASQMPKTYRVTAADRLGEEQLAALRRGVAIPTAAAERGRRGRTRPAAVEVLEEPPRGRVLRITISEGRNRQVRRMLEAVGSRVVALHREAIGPLRLGELPRGVWRELTAAELAALRRAAGLAG